MKTPGWNRVLRYHHSLTGKPWLECEQNHARIPDDLARKIFEQIPPGMVFKEGERFEVTPKSDFSVDVIGTSRAPLEVPLEVPVAHLQTLSEWRDWLGKVHAEHPRESIDLLAQNAMSAQVFEFGNVEEARLKRENPRALDLHQRGFLDTPYNCVIYRYTGEISGRVAVIALRDGPVLQYGGIPNTTDHLIWPLSLMLATKGTKLREEAPSEKLQSKRAARGKSRLPRVTYVDAEHYYEAVRNSDSKGTHASPVPHLRRGHIRHWKDRDIWIRDMLINCKSINEIDQREKYQVKHA